MRDAIRGVSFDREPLDQVHPEAVFELAVRADAAGIWREFVAALLEGLVLVVRRYG